MSDWSKNSEEMFRSWEETQKRLMRSWQENFEKVDFPQGAEFWSQSIQNWQETAKKSIQAQLEWTDTWVENLSSLEGLPDEAKVSAERYREMSDQWLKTQSELWSSWFDMLSKMNPATYTENWMDLYKDSMSTWQKATENILAGQSAWWRAWMPGESEGKGET